MKKKKKKKRVNRVVTCKLMIFITFQSFLFAHFKPILRAFLSEISGMKINYTHSSCWLLPMIVLVQFSSFVCSEQTKQKCYPLLLYPLLGTPLLII